jgi:hypothetical protein
MKYRQAKKFLKQEMTTALELLNVNPFNASASALYKFAFTQLKELKRKKRESK